MPCKFNFLSDTTPAGQIRCFIQRSIHYVWDNHSTTVLTVVAGVVAWKTFKFLQYRSRRKKWDSVPKDEVVLHALGRSCTISHFSPFVVKLETYLRMTGIKYQLCTEVPIGPKGKFPWITINGQDMGDSQLIIEFLNKKLNKNLKKGLTDEQRAVGRVFQVVADEHIFWGLAWYRLFKDDFLSFQKTKMFSSTALSLFASALQPKFKKSLAAQGFGRHSDVEKIEFIRKDLEAVSLYLGDKQFLMGDEPTEFDCSVYGMISQLAYTGEASPFYTMVHNDYPNLARYADRITQKYYPDLDQLKSEVETKGIMDLILG